MERSRDGKGTEVVGKEREGSEKGRGMEFRAPPPGEFASLAVGGIDAGDREWLHDVTDASLSLTSTVYYCTGMCCVVVLQLDVVRRCHHQTTTSSEHTHSVHVHS